MALGVAHPHIDEERHRNHRGQVVVEPALVADGLEPERNRFRGAPEDRHADGVRQADAHGPDVRRKELGLHDGVDRRIAGDDQPGAANQQKRGETALGSLQRVEQRNGEQAAHHAEPDQQRLAADAIR